MRPFSLLVWLVSLAAATCTAFAQVTVNLQAQKDNTIWDDQGNLYASNGVGPYLFVGNNDVGNTRRALLKFDLSAIPAGSTITNVTLTLHESRSRAGTQTVTLHRLLADWGEGTSNSGNPGGGGDIPTPGDVTWIHRFFDTLVWTAPGGDFVTTPSASAAIPGSSGFYSWTSPGMVSDAQSWLDNPASNFGWIVVGNETTNQTAYRFDSRENGTLANRPVLSITYFPPAGVGACCVGTSCTQTTSATCASLGGTFQGAGTSCSPNPCGGTIPVSATASKDNTLYQVAIGATQVSNGAGTGFFVGGGDMQNPTYPRRGVLAFDLSSIPQNAVITSASLQLYMTFTQDTASRTIAVHRLLEDFGEGASVASGNQTNGATAQTGDATWLDRVFPTTPWTLSGGTFETNPSATKTIGTTTGTFHTWSGAGLIADVQAWVSNPASNFGWCLVSSEETTRRTQRRFETRESATPSWRPTLSITYTLAPTGACCLGNGSCATLTQAQCAAQGGTYQGDSTMCGMVNCPLQLTPFVDALPRPGVATPVSGVPGGAAHYELEIREFFQQLHRDLPPTRLWGYGGTYPGPTIEARRDLPVTVIWKNQLRVFETQQLRSTHVLPVDTCLHGPDTTGSVPVTVTHLHGGHVPSGSDGYPEDTFPPGSQSTLYTYPNIQPAGTLWYHDHALGITRLNVYMGMAGFYLLRDDEEDALDLPEGLYEVPLAIQDRSFNADGSLKYQDMWMEHFFGDFILVNGKVWPFLNVDRGKYRFRLLNGSGSRTYRLRLSNGATFWQIGTDLGLLPAPVPLTELVITPGERADVIMDFAPYAPGTEIILTNDAPAPFPTGGDGAVIPNVMKFVVGAASGHTAPIPASLVPVPLIPESEAILQRDFNLRRGMISSECPSHMTGMWMINDLMWHDITEEPEIGTTEIWAWVNRSGVTHPMHMHLVAFQILDRQAFDIIDGNVVPTGPRIPPAPNERGWKDTVQAPPNMITRVITRFENFTGLFSYHCHILEHEDHEMMRQFRVVCTQPSFPVSPLDVSACQSGSAVFTATLAGSNPRVIGWELERPNAPGLWVPLADGFVEGLGTVSGSSTNTLSIASPRGSGVRVRSTLANPCGSATSLPATLFVCIADWDCNGEVEPLDVRAFFNAYRDGEADVDGNGETEPLDVRAFFDAYRSGC